MGDLHTEVNVGSFTGSSCTHNVDIAVIPETKKKLKGSQELEDYILLYSE
jgi:hypothetical protein